ncbi:xanthine dehydrogenase family protein molybdopterin-binding subunit [Chloroflexota bacterium]
MSQEFSFVGKRIPPPDRAEKATGSAVYGADIKLPGMLVGKVLRSPHPHAKIMRIDTSKAENLPGVKAIITKDDVPKKAFNVTILPHYMLPPELRGDPLDQYVLNDKVRFIGDAVAAVAATNESIADKALELLDVEYEELPAVFDPIEAMKPDAPKIHDFSEDNVSVHLSFPFPTGDVEKGFQEADSIVDATFRAMNQDHCPLEPTVCVASFDTDGRLTVWSPCQIIHPAKKVIAYIFDIPEGKIRWLTPHIGGAFGAKQSLTAEPICIALARKAGKPVKLESTRAEELTAFESRERVIQNGKLGVKNDGTITALQTKVIADAGGYLTHSSVTTFINMRGFLHGAYRCPNTAAEADVVYTNTPIAGGMRGYGDSGGVFTMGQLIDMAAEKVGMDTVEFVLKNIKRAGDPSLVPFLTLEDSGLEDCIKLGAEKIGWKGKKAKKKEGVKRRGIGMACGAHNTTAYPVAVEHSSATIKLNPDGSANLVVGSCEMGQGILGSLVQIAAEGLGINAGDIHVIAGDTDITQFDAGSHASRSLYVMGNAVLEAAREAKGQLLERAGKTLGVPVEELDVKESRIYVKSAPEKGLPVAEVAQNAIYNFEGESLNISGRSSLEAKQLSPSFIAIFAEIEVDTETGKLKVLRIVIAADVGRAINPMTVEGQLEGAAIQGLGYALTEDFAFDKNTGVPISDSLESYKIPSTLDLPNIEVILVDRPVPSGPFGAKGAGEIGLVCVAPAIANAIYDAMGIRVKELPMMPERII